MNTFKVKQETGRNYECTNIKACQCATVPPASRIKWVLTDDSALKGLTHLYTQGGIKFYGHL